MLGYALGLLALCLDTLYSPFRFLAQLSRISNLVLALVSTAVSGASTLQMVLLTDTILLDWAHYTTGGGCLPIFHSGGRAEPQHTGDELGSKCSTFLVIYLDTKCRTWTLSGLVEGKETSPNTKKAQDADQV